MDGHSGIGAWARTHPFVVVRVSLGLVCACLPLVFAGDLRASLEEAPEESAEHKPAWILAPKRIWNARERAVSRPDTHALRRVSTQPSLPADLARARSGHDDWRGFVSSFAWFPRFSGTMMIARIETMRGLRLVALRRPHRSRRWRIAVDVPLNSWPWPEPFPQTEGRPVTFRITKPLEALRADDR